MKNKTIRKSRFTLIELLVVIAIIGILTGILLPAISGSMKEGKKTKAASTARQIAMAVEAYMSEYGTLPMGGSTDTTDSDINSTDVLDLISGSNVRKKVFFEHDGSTLKNAFGNAYMISLDGDYNNSISANSGESVSGKVAVWSNCDGDIVKSWVK